MSRALGSASEDAAPARRHDTTATHPVAAPSPPRSAPRPSGYVPPRAPEPAPRVVHRAPPPSPRPRPARRRTGGSVWSLLGTLAILAAAGAVVVFAILLIRDARQGGAGETPPAASVAATPVGATVAVPDTVGMPTEDAIRAATEAGLNWTVYCNHDEEQPEGIIDQEPPAGTEVRRGSAFSMYSARIADCP